MSDMTPEKAIALRKPFPPESIGRLPKGGQMLDYAGHAAVTDRLLAVDPEWSWEPLALGADGLPAYDRNGNLWIKLTICGVTRLGVGDGKQAKEVIGDAIRNSAMRFGVALDLWAKEDLVEFAQAARSHRASPPPPEAAPVVPDEPEPAQTPEEAVPIKDRTRGRLFALLGERGIDDRAEQIRGIVHIIGRPIESRSELTEAEARQVIDVLQGAGQVAS